MLQAGGALEKRLQHIYADHMEQIGGKFFVMYGQTEATARISYVPPKILKKKLGSAEIAIPCGNITIETIEKDVNDSRPIGEVLYDGPNVMVGYSESREDLQQGDVLDGKLRTGDLGYLDEEGFLLKMCITSMEWLSK